MTKRLEVFGRTLVVAPHPDDETLGAGGTIARLAKAGHQVTVAVVTTGQPPDYSASDVAKVRHEAEQAHAILGVRQTLWLDLPAARLVETPRRALNAALQKAIAQTEPTTMLLPFVGDVHIDHQLVFEAGMVAARPHQAAYPATILAYETLSETNWNAPYLTPGFIPNVFIDITDTLELKLAGNADLRLSAAGQPPRTIDRGAEGAGDAARSHRPPAGSGSLRPCPRRHPFLIKVARSRS